MKEIALSLIAIVIIGFILEALAPPSDDDDMSWWDMP